MLFITFRLEVLFVAESRPEFRLLGDGVKLLNAANRILANTGFPRQHDRIRALVNRIGNVRDFGSRRDGVINHGFKHVGCHD